MPERAIDLFDPPFPLERINPLLIKLREWAGAEPARLMINEVFAQLDKMDKNFVEQFQTTGFDARVFELYLFAYFSRNGYTVTRVGVRPDFLTVRDGFAVAVEVTTANPSQRGMSEAMQNTDRVTEAGGEFHAQTDQAAVMRLGSALFSKLQKKYWELPHCRGLPLVFAIEAFYSDESLYQSSSSLADYLYGIRQKWRFDEQGSLEVINENVDSHRLGEKTIPSSFFSLPGAENVSAILFSNSGTWAKFGRMGYQAGYHRGNLRIVRRGFYFNPDPNSTTPRELHYELRDPPFEETWGQGLVVLHNPNAIHPIPKEYFVDAAQIYQENGQLPALTPGNHPYSSHTFIIVDPGVEYTPLRDSAGAVGTILRSEFDKLGPWRSPLAEVTTRETVWYANKPNTLIGAVFEDLTDHDYNWVMLGRDEYDTFRFIDVGSCYATQEESQRALMTAMTATTETGQTTFP